jgi:hypothetical protein
VVDVDILKEGGSVWTSFLDSGEIPEIERGSLSLLRHELKKKFDESGKNMKRDGGVTILNENDREAANNLFNKLAEYGLFVVPNGELESWLCNFNVPGHGPNWLVDIFEKMGEDPSKDDYLKPGNDDVWAFIDRITEWLLNQDRKGIPN